MKLFHDNVLLLVENHRHVVSNGTYLTETRRKRFLSAFQDTFRVAGET